MAKRLGCNLEFVREDDFVEYFLFPQLPDNLLPAGGEALENPDVEQLVRTELLTVLAKCNEVVERRVKQLNYIWHKDEFQLQVRTESKQERLLNEESKGDPVPPHLHGVTHYGDNIADEWFIVNLLYELTREVPGCIARVFDSDGEFLLIEAADMLPKWANPDTCEQRVYIFEGNLNLVQNSPTNTAKLMTVTMAIGKIRQNPTLYRVSKEIEACVNERLKEFQVPHPALHHHQIVRLPLGVAALLKQHPNLISSAVRAFCERDSLDMKACKSMRYFPPEQRVRTNICFTRCLYAMIMHNDYVPDRKIGWNLGTNKTTDQYKEDLLGVKVACGFEILASQAKEAGNEINEPAWRAFIRSLTAKGYFRENLEGSAEYKQLLANAEAYYKANNARFRTTPVVGKEILDLLRNLEINAEELRDEENNIQPSDSDNWLNITAEQLDAMLLERYGPKKLYKANGDINAEEFTKNLAEFLEKETTFEGVESCSDDDVDDDDNNMDYNLASPSKRSADFKAKVKKNNSMRKACKQNPVTCSSKNEKQQQKSSAEDDNLNIHVKNFLDFVIPEDSWDSNSEMSDYEDEEDLERNIEAMTNTAMGVDVDIKEYMAQMDRELAQTTIGQTFERNTSGRKSAGGDDFDDIETFKPININVNTLKNMMDSYKSQIGGSGPVSNLLNAMGAGMAVAGAELDEEAKKLKESTV